MSSKRNLKRQLKAAHQAINDLLARLIDYAEDLDEANNWSYDLWNTLEDYETQMEGLRKNLADGGIKYTEAVNQSEHYKAQVDRLLAMCQDLRNIANDALQQRNEALKEMAADLLHGEEVIDGKNIKEWCAEAKDLRMSLELANMQVASLKEDMARQAAGFES